MTEPAVSPPPAISEVVEENVFTAPPLPPAAPRRPWKDRTALRAAARWTLAVLVCGGLGTGTAYGITGMTRTDVPGLATQDDGRWTYPKLSLPALPADAPRPFTDGNAGEVHHADLRKLLLPAPEGATQDKTLNGGWVSTDRYTAEYAKSARSALKQELADASVRHIAARGWTMPDGTTTRIYLVQFKSTAFAQAFKDDTVSIGYDGGTPLVEAPTARIDDTWSSNGSVENNTTYVYAEAAPYGAQQVRQAYVLSGDTVALIFHSRKGTVPKVPFHQTVILQDQLLG
ncbi:hypothetical protein [Streptomyces sp. NPDC050738]|uniref:hypothetical protein n=1 Tax=Streptomyces sp. NPDC050738 TaxID=3154744 RepID=UPI0034134476